MNCAYFSTPVFHRELRVEKEGSSGAHNVDRHPRIDAGDCLYTGQRQPQQKLPICLWQDKLPRDTSKYTNAMMKTLSNNQNDTVIHTQTERDNIIKRISIH